MTAIMKPCLRCLHTFSGDGCDERLSRHQPDCLGINSGGSQKIQLPTKGKDDILSFKDWDKTLKMPFTMYLDFESTLEKLERKEDQNTQKLQRHSCSSYSFITIGPNGDKIQELSQFYRGSDPSKHCLQFTIQGRRSITSEVVTCSLSVCSL
jgi:hypothetical protein